MTVTAIAGARHQPSRHLRFVMPVVHEALTQEIMYLEAAPDAL